MKPLENSPEKTEHVDGITDQKLLRDLVKNGSTYNIKEDAARRLTDQALIVEIVIEHKGRGLGEIAFNNLRDRDLLWRVHDLPYDDIDYSIREAALKRIGDLGAIQKVVEQYPANDESTILKLAVAHINDKLLLREIADRLQSITDQRRLAEVADIAYQPMVRRAAAELITDQTLLAEMVEYSKDPQIRQIATSKINDQTVLRTIVEQNSNLLVRKSAVIRMTDQTILAEFAKNDSRVDVREAAVTMITDQKLLSHIAYNDPAESVRKAAISNIQDQSILVEIARRDPCKEVKEAAVRQISDQPYLEEIVANVYDLEVKGIAVAKLTNQSLLHSIITGDRRLQIMQIAVGRIDDQKILFDIAKNEPTEEIRMAAFERLKDQTFLADFAKNARKPKSRKSALERITNESVLSDIVKNASDAEIRYLSLGKVTDNSTIEDIAHTAPDYQTRICAMGKLISYDRKRNFENKNMRIALAMRLPNQSMIADIATNDPNLFIAYCATRRLTNEGTRAAVGENSIHDRIRQIVVKGVANRTTTGLAKIFQTITNGIKSKHISYYVEVDTLFAPEGFVDIFGLHRSGDIRIRGWGQTITNIKVEIENRTNSSIRVYIPHGTYFVANGNHQNMVTRYDHSFTISARSHTQLDIPAACINANLPIPNLNDGFGGISRVSDSLLSFLVQSQGEDTMTIQAGVWAITDGYNRSAIQSHLRRRGIDQRTLREFDHGSAISEGHIEKAKEILDALGISNKL
jgi:hypothetical protein